MNQNGVKIACRILLLLALGVITAIGQQPQPSGTPLTRYGDAPVIRPVEERLTSKLMAREMPYRVILPYGYSTNSIDRFPVIYLLHGLTGHFNNWTEKTKLASYAFRHNFIIVTPEGNDGWYTDSASTPNDKYESYIVKELIPEIDKNYRTLADRKNRAIAGLSMGGYGSLKFGLKYPEMFALAGSFSGALGAASFSEKTAGAIGKTIDGFAIEAILGPRPDSIRKVRVAGDSLEEPHG